MVRVMIVDDDFLVRTNLKFLIETSDYCRQNQVVYVASAENGEKALQLLDSAKPDIIISDVCMPVMDGLVLQQKLKEKKHHAKMIMLSGYDDIAYVRQSLKSGAIDYILKHELNEQTLKEVLSRAAMQVHTVSDLSLPPDAQSVIIRDFMLKLLSGFYKNSEEVRYHAKIMGLDFGAGSCAVLLMCVTGAGNDVVSSYVAEYSILNITDEILREYTFGSCCHVSDENYAVILSFKDINSELRQQEIISSIQFKLQNTLHNYLNLNVTFYNGSTVMSVSNIDASYAEAVKQKKGRFYPEAQKTKGNEQPFDIFSVFDSECERKLFNAIRSNTEQEAVATVTELFSKVNGVHYSADSMHYLFADVISTVHRGCKERNLDFNQLYPQGVQEKAFKQMRSKDQMQEWFLDVLHDVFQQMSSDLGSPNQHYIQLVVNYIHQNYMNDISQTMAAEAIGITPSYLSRLFKEDLHVGFTDYLNAYRIEKAKFLLQQGVLSNIDIAKRCGFNGDAYFARIFKRVTGYTPKEYKRRSFQKT